MELQERIEETEAFLSGFYFPLFEQSFVESAERFMDMRNGPLRYGRRLQYNDYAQLIPQIAADTQDFLGLASIKPFTYSLRGYYHVLRVENGQVLPEPFKQKMQSTIDDLLLSTDRPFFFSRYMGQRTHVGLANMLTNYSAPGYVAHELAHHVQQTEIPDFMVEGPLWYVEDPDMEGFPIGVERAIAERAMVRGDSISYGYEAIFRTARHMKFAYKHIAEMQERVIPASVQRLIETMPDVRWPAPHIGSCLGAAAFYVAEQQHGKEIYREVVKERKPLLEVLGQSF